MSADEPLGCGPDDIGSYSIALHGAAIGILCAVSIAGFTTPMLVVAASSTRVRLRMFIIEMGKAFGTGVVISTGFIHMLSESAQQLGSECAPEVFRNYDGLPFVFCIGTIFLIQALEFLIARSLMAPSAPHTDRMRVSTVTLDSDGGFTADDFLSKEMLPATSPHADEEHDTGKALHAHGGHGHSHGHSHGHIHQYDPHLSHMAKLRKRVSVMVLDTGIAIHSIIIGITLGVQQNGSAFTTLLAALSFHQFFEGWALSEATREAQYASRWAIIGTGAMYALTTPIGIAIGMGVHSTYNGNSSTTIVVQGTLDAICSGVLIYMGIVQFMFSWFTSNDEFMRMPLWWIFCVYLSLLGGMAAMAVVGIWC